MRLTEGPSKRSESEKDTGGRSLSDGMNWDLLDRDPEQWIRERYPDLTEEQISKEVEFIDRTKLIERYEVLKKEVQDKYPDLYTSLYCVQEVSDD